jgi:DNA-binding response OmpR family regulator
VDALKSRILIADPDPDVSRTLKIYFEANRHEITCTQFAGDILKTARQWQPNAILISTQLSDRDPYIVCRDILEDTLTAHIPVIMLLHLNHRQARLDALEVGADSFITKPFDIEELRLRVESAIRFSTVWTPA